ncbi:MAG: acetylxylan esterase [Armatimonadota bacterium]
MPVFEMSLAELKTYQGRNPRPADFDAYWDGALAEMHALDAKVELVPAAFTAAAAECFDLYFTGVGGARIHAKYLRPKSAPKPHPAIVEFHGYSGNSGDWAPKLKWVSQGFSVAALDCRGQGGQSEDVGGVLGNTLRGHIIRGLDDQPQNLLFRQIYLDCAQLAGIVMDMPEVDGKRVGATGGSQGGGLTLACAALEPRIARAAPVFPFLCDYQRVWEMDLAVAAYEEIRQYFRFFDPRHEREQDVWTKLGYIDNQHLAPRIRAKVLMIVGLMDQVCPPSTQFAAYNKITSDKEMVLYPDFGHEGLPGADDTIFGFMAEL